MSNHIQIGVTGGIGSGKSIVCRIFKVLGIPVYDADKRAKELMNSDPELIIKIKTLFGEKAYDGDQLNRRYIAESAFNHEETLRKLNEATHPQVRKDYIKWLEVQDTKFVIEEAALIFEAGIASKLDFVIVVTAPEKLRIERVIQRDGRTKEEILNIIKNQWPEKKKSDLADATIINDNTQLIVPQILTILEQLKREANLN